ncbi:hypothetical protein HJD16_11040, partial [Enterococcus faecium]|nr:hypothetical protein [Enterococcus faecium]
MKPIDFPEKYENLMRVAQQALANQQYQQAKELFQRAYELKESFEANSLLVFWALCQMMLVKRNLRIIWTEQKEENLF